MLFKLIYGAVGIIVSDPVTIDTRSETLPVTLSSFTAICTESNIVNIEWTTQSESNMIGYYIFRSVNNEVNTSVRVSTLFAAGNQTETAHYLFTDQETENDQIYYYWLQSCDLDGSSQYFGPLQIKTGFGHNPQTPLIPLTTRLNAAYPNPFNPSTSISYDLAENSRVIMEVFNIKGQKIKTLLNQDVNSGRYSILWNGKDDYNKSVASGVYFCRMQAGKYHQQKKLMLIK